MCLVDTWTDFELSSSAPLLQRTPSGSKTPDGVEVLDDKWGVHVVLSSLPSTKLHTDTHLHPFMDELRNV